METAGPWIDYIIDQYQAEADQAEPNRKAMIQMVQTQVHTLTDVLKALRTITSEVYFEDGVMVNHGLVEFRDVEK